MNKKFFFYNFHFLLAYSCSRKDASATLGEFLQNNPSIEGKVEYINSPYVMAGIRDYMVGHQDGSLPEIGWRVKGGMGVFYLHPFKLQDLKFELIGRQPHY